MQFMRLVGAALVACFCAPVAMAENLALLLGDRGQSVVYQDRDGPSADAFRDVLSEAGFRVLDARDRDIRSMRLAAVSTEIALGRGDVDRLVIVVNGPFASDGQDSWSLSNNAIGSTRVAIGAMGISLNALTTLAAAQDIPSVIAIVPGGEPGDLAVGLLPGPQGYRVDDRVTYITGSAPLVSALLRDTVLSDGASFADIASDAPRGVTVAGNVSNRLGLMGEVQGGTSDAGIEEGFWRAVQALDTVDGYRLYGLEFPDGQFRDEARQRIEFLATAPEREARAAEEALELSREDRKELQRDLALLGFDPRGIDGILGQGSRSAIAEWQDDNGFDATGFISADQRTRLRAQAQEEAERQEELARLLRQEEDRKDRQYWREVGRAENEEGARAYLERYPDGLFAERARERLAAFEEIRRAEAEEEERLAWDAAKDADDADSYRAFLNTYPESGFAPAALARLDELQAAAQNAAVLQAAQTQERQFVSTLVGRVLIERRLAQLGADPGAQDGNFTQKTRRAIRQFQRSRELPVTGYVDQETMVRLLGGR
jgi:peptidoglycan hydrolase-like protein with peptidoglycan-binding domain